MWRIILFISVAVYDFSVATDECDSPLTQFCEINDYDFDVPKTKDDLATLCKNGKQALECVVAQLTKCDANEDVLSKFLGIQSKVNEICDEHNILYQIVYGDIECISTALTSAYFGCPESVDKGVEKVVIEKKLATRLEGQDRCLPSLYLLSCHITHIQTLCGKLPRDATLEVFKILQLPIQCHPDIAAELSTIVETIEKISQEEKDFEK